MFFNPIMQSPLDFIVTTCYNSNFSVGGRKMKNPIAYLKHILKDPINTNAEAEARKKEIMPLLYISIGIAVVPCILMTFLSLDFLGILSFIGVVCIIVCAFLLFVIKKAKEKFAALTCNSCKTMFTADSLETFKDLVSYEVVKENFVTKTSHPSSNNGVISEVKVTGESTAVLSVSFKCPNCGETKSFKYTITPFRGEIKFKKVTVTEVELVKARLETEMKEVAAVYNSEKREQIPYSIHSMHHPNYADRDKPQLGITRPQYNGVTITYHREIDEMVEGLFLNNELNGKINA